MRNDEGDMTDPRLNSTISRFPAREPIFDVSLTAFRQSILPTLHACDLVIGFTVSDGIAALLPSQELAREERGTSPVTDLLLASSLQGCQTHEFHFDLLMPISCQSSEQLHTTTQDGTQERKDQLSDGTGTY